MFMTLPFNRVQSVTFIKEIACCSVYILEYDVINHYICCSDKKKLIYYI